ncbi:MAG TPA: methylmalonyl-CoA mutase family protein [Chloroflexota bacterium]|nr:methylmalonyl-CoA mutase family protein [Chloroflexota bacterium]
MAVRPHANHSHSKDRTASSTDGEIAAIEAAHQRWQQETVAPTIQQHAERQNEFANLSGLPIERLYTPLDRLGHSYLDDIGFPGEYPFTRGVYPTMHRGRLWTMRMFAGFGSAEETNRRFKYLLAHGQNGLSVAFDLPTLYGYDADHPNFAGEFGHCGVGISSLADMELLFDGIPLDQVTTSMTINGPAAVIWAMYLATAEKRGIPFEHLGGTLQNDILKEYIAQKEYIFPPGPAMRLVTDTVEFASQYLPRWHPISISGYHIREAGSTAIQELAFTLADGITYVEHARARGLDVDAFASQLSFFFNAHNDFFEEIAKYRAARRLWARTMRERLGATKSQSLLLRFHAQTAGCSLTAQQPDNNVVRTTLQALAAVLGGCQSLHTNSLDEALALPSERAARIALRTQQIIAYESGVTNTVDPLGGSYFVETLTDQMEQAAQAYIDEIDRLGGVIAAIESGYFQRQIGESAYQYQHQIDQKERIIVGVNAFLERDEVAPEILRFDERWEREHLARLNRVRRERDTALAMARLARLREAARGNENLMPALLDCVRVYCTLGEIVDQLRAVFGEYREAPIT